eukprot:Gregarina_sp_Pseudo_9__2457@NODE_2744_length_887_cov_33_245283_g2510_i0_p1_GENE_NODE_2744_length_887_cov_33_245283_g2510_i0NODE_2744_length_887_cov_33_245283_g2510_i0_p1_ORF_typecomplete_len126_score3_73Ribosomal_L37e/PF01907_19/8_4e15Ribosomal_L37e/PF01907_19/8_7e05Ribosomal_L37e/PF01907_19/8e03CxC3/PF18804_1/0_056NRDD/PF13597_6/2_3_NODE_2744_length_887_cov_33_245283_g2510_i0508834
MGKCGKGTGSRGLRNNKTHELCRRCGRTSFHIQKRACASCGKSCVTDTVWTRVCVCVAGYPAAQMRKFNWSQKALRRRTTGTGRMRYLKHLPRVAKNGFGSRAAKASN